MPKEKFVPRVPSYTEYMAWVDQIQEDSVGWQRSQNNVSEAELGAYAAGLRQGMITLLATLRLQGLLPPV